MKKRYEYPERKILPRFRNVLNYRIYGKSKIFRKYFNSYLMIVIISMLIGLVSYYISVRIIEREITNAHQKSLIQIKNVSDNILRELEMLYIQVGFDETTRMLLALSADMTPLQLLEMAKVEKELKRYLLAYPVIQDVYLYFDRSEKVLSNYGKHDIHTFLEMVYQYNPDDFETWIGTNYTGIEVFDVKDDDDDARNMIAYVRGLPVGRVDHFLGKLIVVLNDEFINVEMENFEWIKQGRRFAINDRDQVFLDSNASEIDYTPGFSDLENGTKMNSSDGMVLSCVESDIFDWKYVYLIPKRIFFEKAKLVKNYILSSLLFILVVGFFLSYFFAKKYYYPIDRLILFIQNNIKELKSRNEDEYYFIKKIITNTLAEKKTFQENAKKYSERLRSDFMLKVLKGKLDENAIEHMKTIHEVEVARDANYILIMGYLNDVSLIDHENGHGEAGDIDIARIILRNTIDELLQSKYQRLYVNEDDLFVCVVGAGDIHPVLACDDVTSAAEKLLEISKSKFGISVYCAVSKACNGYEGLVTAYAEVRKNVEYYLLTGSEQQGIVDIKNSDVPRTACVNFRRSVDQLSRCLLSSDVEGAHEVLENVCRTWLVDSGVSANVIRFRMHEVVSSCVNAVESLNVEYGTQIADCEHITNTLMNCRNVEELHIAVVNLFDDMGRHFLDEKFAEPDMIQMSMKYVDGNYHDVDLNISMIADHFDVSVPCLSRKFKKSTGIGPLEYLQLKRIEEAKKLIRSTEESIKTISKRVGFAYEVSFIRVFKKFEGVTPGVYRDRLFAS